MKTYIYIDNQTGQKYRSRFEIEKQTLGDLPYVVRKAAGICDGVDMSQTVVEYFSLSLSKSLHKLMYCNKLPMFDWITFLMDDIGLVGDDEMTKIRKKVIATCEGRVVYVTKGGKITSKPLYGSIIPVGLDSVVGIYRVGYGDGRDSVDGKCATLTTNKDDVKALCSYYMTRLK
ncbi:MAG: hypothetical protein J6Y37_12085 [Paludibacteraceae bacterium]|nr:hypothetical protein [Paludibacteraceae bacterium]